MVDNNRWLQFSRFCEVTLLTIIVKELYTHIKTHMAPPLAGGEKELSLWEAALSMAYVSVSLQAISCRPG